MKPVSTVIDLDVIYADFLRIPESVVGEIIAGELHAHPRPSPRHAQVSIAVSTNLYRVNQVPTSRMGGVLSLSRNRNLLKTSCCRTSQEVVKTRCRSYRKLIRAPSDLTGCVRCCRPPQRCQIETKIIVIYAELGIGYAWLIDSSTRIDEVFELGKSYMEPMSMAEGVSGGPRSLDTRRDDVSAFLHYSGDSFNEKKAKIAQARIKSKSSP